MEVIAFTNGAIQIGVILAASLHVADAKARRLVLVLAGASLAFSIAGLLLRLLPTLPDIAGQLASWALYVGIGLAVLLGMVWVWRSAGGVGRMRVMWPQGRYARYRQYQGYRRI